jgi:hypothetical protein
MDSVVPAVVQSFMYNEMLGGGGGGGSFINKSKSKSSSVIQRKSVSYKEENIEVIDDRTFDRFLEKMMVTSPRSASLIGAERQSVTSPRPIGERQSVTKRRQTKSKSMKYVKKEKINL